MIDSPSPPHVLRSAVAVLSGLLAIFILSIGTDILMHVAGIYPALGDRMADPLFVLATAYRILYAIAGCYLAARLAPSRPMAHAMALGFIGLVLCLVGWLATRNADLGPAWYSMGLVVTTLPCAWAGGALQQARLAPGR